MLRPMAVAATDPRIPGPQASSTRPVSSDARAPPQRSSRSDLPVEGLSTEFDMHSYRRHIDSGMRLVGGPLSEVEELPPEYARY